MLESNPTADALGRPRFVVVLGRDVPLADLDACLFHWLANIDPGRDWQGYVLDLHASIRTDTCDIWDATPKSDHPLDNSSGQEIHVVYQMGALSQA